MTSLRFFAALMVFFSHLNFLAQSDSPTAVHPFNDVMYEGYVGFYLVIPTPSARNARLLQCASLVLLATFLYFGKYVSQAHRFDVYYVAPMAFVIFSFAFQSGVLARVISGRLLMLWGEASFAFYLVHQLIIIAGQDVRLRIGSDHALLTDISYAIMYFLIALAISVLLFKYYESPARAKMLSLMGARRRAFVG